MPRRRKGRRIDGWLVVDKPKGVGSTDVVSKARWALQAQKAGHAGTLDPLATGVLAIAFGEATKTVPYAQEGAKTYRFTVRWGSATNTDDAEGEVIATAAARPSAAEIEAALPDFVGVVMQRPPAFSAIKVDGARAYDLAREGAAPELAPRPIRIDALRLIETPRAEEAVLEMVCGKGGYVRAVARDLGERLGCFGHVTALRRLTSGPFTLDEAISFEMLDRLRDTSPSDLRIAPVAAGLDDIPALTVDGGTAAMIRNGQAAPVIGALAGQDLSYGDAVWASHDGAPVAVGVYRAGSFHPTRVFAPPAAGAERPGFS
ncbi:MAG: tRNA pseudouridine(55) synthase TruB [Pseudomonadota bacterium]